MVFSNKIIAWYQLQKRDLPWRETKDPYRVWLSEIIMQQTRVAQGLSYYNKFIDNYPRLHDLANASEQEVLKLWQGLGYYSRARNLLFTAKVIINDLGGRFPLTYDELIKLKGIGEYTAAAISSFCNDEVRSVVDGNVYRVLARYFGIHTPINTTQAKKEFKALASELIDRSEPGLYNQAIMEFGALQCTSMRPNCKDCPLHNDCIALQKDQVGILPKKEKRQKITKRFFNYLVLETKENETFVKQRKGKGIWQNLYEFPLVETTNEIDFDDLVTNIDFVNLVKKQNFNVQLITPEPIIHKLSHQHLNVRFWSVRLDRLENNRSIPWKEVMKYPFPIVIYNFIERYIS